MMTTFGDEALLDDALRAVVLGRLANATEGLTPQDRLRLDFFVQAMTGSVAPAGLPDLPPGVLFCAAQDVMALFGQASAEAVFVRRGSILVRAASRVRAQNDPSCTGARHAAQPQDLNEVAWRQPYGKFFAMEEVDIGWRRFDGQMTAPITRAVFVSGDAVTVLPYDPVRDRVLVVEQFRAGPYARGDRQPWQIEAIAGRIDPDETPEMAARREAVEEAGLTLGSMHRVAGYYPSPGAVTEYLYSYVSLVDLPDGAAGVFGLAEEQEDIRGHILGFDRLMEMVASGEIANAPLILTAYWLAQARSTLRAKT
jgi:ADP-ribose pyrophosphatase